MPNGYNASALLRLQRIVTYFHMQYADSISKANVTPAQFEILLYLAESSPCSITDVAEFLLVDTSTASRSISGLVDRQLVAVTPDPEDKRRKRVSLTASGAELQYVTKRVWDNIDQTICDKYGKAIEYLQQL